MYLASSDQTVRGTLSCFGLLVTASHGCGSDHNHPKTPSPALHLPISSHYSRAFLALTPILTTFPMPHPPPNISRYSLRLQIDPLTSAAQHLSEKTSGGSSSALGSVGSGQSVNWCFESPSGTTYERLCGVVCLYDFDSPDPDHLSFKEGDILQVVKQEQTGWWAAARNDGVEVGWIPASYVRIIDGSDRRADVSQDVPSPPPSYHDTLTGAKLAPPRFLDAFGPPEEGLVTVDQNVFNTTRVVSSFVSDLVT